MLICRKLLHGAAVHLSHRFSRQTHGFTLKPATVVILEERNGIPTTIPVKVNVDVADLLFARHGSL